LNNYKKIAYYAVFDGHGGDQTAKMVENALHPKILNSADFAQGNIASALAKGFEDMDHEVVEAANKQNAMHGCTGVVCMVLDDQLYMANIGDSEAILVSVTNEAVSSQNMTTPHKATDPTEKGRIESLGGHVFFGRVFGALAVSRSFGDAKYKKPKTSQNFVSFEPAIQVEKLTQNHRYLILACDGLWDVLTHEEAAALCHKSFESGLPANDAAKALVTAALQRRTEDNVTVIVVKISWSGSQTPPQQHTSQPTQMEATTETQITHEKTTDNSKFHEEKLSAVDSTVTNSASS